MYKDIIDIENSYNECLTSDLTLNINFLSILYDIDVEFVFGEYYNDRLKKYLFSIIRTKGCLIIEDLELKNVIFFVSDLNFYKPIPKVFYHELGHLLDLILFKKYYFNDDIDNYENCYFSHYDNDFLYLFNNEKDNLSKKYGVINGNDYYCKFIHEGFAQLFCEYVLDDCSDEVHKYFNKLLLKEELIENYNKRSMPHIF